MPLVNTRRAIFRAGCFFALGIFTVACNAPNKSDPSSNTVETPAQSSSAPLTGTGTTQTDPNEHGSGTTSANGTANIQLQGSIPAIDSNLGEKRSFVVTVKALGDFAGPVALFATKDGLDTTYNAGMDIQISVTPSQITLAKDASQDVTVDVNITPRAPSFKSPSNGGDGHFFVKAQTDVSGQIVVAALDVPLQVNPVYEIRLYGPGTTAPHRYDRPTMGEVAQTEIRAHSGGVSLRFYNYDTTETHIIHGTGLIPHQSTGNPMAKAPAEGTAGGSYQFKVTSTAKQKGEYYCHSHEANSNRRAILFNADM